MAGLSPDQAGYLLSDISSIDFVNNVPAPLEPVQRFARNFKEIVDDRKPRRVFMAICVSPDTGLAGVRGRAQTSVRAANLTDALVREGLRQKNFRVKANCR